MGGMGSGRYPKGSARELTVAYRDLCEAEAIKEFRAFFMDFDPEEPESKRRFRVCLDSLYRLAKGMKTRNGKLTQGSIKALTEIFVRTMGAVQQSVAIEDKRTPEENIERVLGALESLKNDCSKIPN